MCEAGSKVVHAAWLREWNVIVVLEDIKALSRRDTAIMSMVVARASSIFIVLVAAEERKHRSIGLSSAAGSIDIQVGEYRTPAHRWRALNFDIHLVVIRLRARDPTLSLKGP
jgi:hypothetical protein